MRDEKGGVITASLLENYSLTRLIIDLGSSDFYDPNKNVNNDARVGCYITLFKAPLYDRDKGEAAPPPFSSAWFLEDHGEDLTEFSNESPIVTANEDTSRYFGYNDPSRFVPRKPAYNKNGVRYDMPYTTFVWLNQGINDITIQWPLVPLPIHAIRLTFNPLRPIS